jgi:hypothetical protein
MIDQLLKVSNCDYLIGGHYHIIHTGKLPSKLKINGVTEEKWQEFLEYLDHNYEWKEDNYIQSEIHSSDGNVNNAYLIHLACDITIYKDINSTLLYYSNGVDEGKLADIKQYFRTLKPKNNPSQCIGIIKEDISGLDVQMFEYSLPEHSLIEYLPPETKQFHQSVTEELQNSNGSGLYLMYGESGTGKTSFIKDILSKADKQALFIAPFFTESLTSPSLMSLLMKYPDSILVIEDAETVLMERKADNSSAVSNLLNLTDGFLADFLNLKIICTFNTGLKNIDDALLREGRLKGMHEFKKIQPKRAREIAEVLGREIDPDGPMTLAQICASEAHKTKYKPKKIGFENGFPDDIEPPFDN